MLWTLTKAATCIISSQRGKDIGKHHLHIFCSEKPLYLNFENVFSSIDATAENGRLGRLVNHSKLNPNCFTKVIWTDKPRLVLMAKCDIQPGTEVLYDYGDRSKGRLASFDWLKY